MARRGERYAVQDRLYAALERLETKDTQHAAVQELQRLIREMEPPTLSTLLHAAGTQTAKTSQFSRRQCLALAAQACTPQGCPHWRAMLEPPLLGKLLGLLGRALRDSNAAVRTAAAEGLGTVAAQLAAAHPGSDATSGTPSNPLLACILEALGEPAAGVQAAAADALAQAADHLGPLDPALLRLLLTALSNPLCGGRTELCGALARLEGGRVWGLVGTSFQQVLAAWPDVLGSAAEGTGLLGVLGCKGKDFGARAAAAGALKALAAGVGPQAPGWDAAAAGLKAAKTDISKPVRDAAAGALPLVAGLLEFDASGAPPDQWPAVCGSLLAPEAGGGKRMAAGGVRAKMAAASRPDEGGPPFQLIAAVHPAMPLPLAAAAASPYAAPPLAVSTAPPIPPPLLVPVAAPPAYPPTGMPPPPPAALLFPQPVAMAAPHIVPQDSSQLAAQLASIQQQQAAMAAALSSFTSATQSTLQQLQLHLSSVSAGVAALAAGSGGSGSGSQAHAIQAHLASVNAGVAALAVGVGGAQQMLASVGVNGAAVPAGAASGPPCCAASWPTSTAGGPGDQAAGCPKRLSSLHRSYDALERGLLIKQQQGGCQPSSPTAGPASPPAGPPSAGYGAQQPAPSPAAAAPDWEAAYAQLLVVGAGVTADQQAQLKLLRCIARSGPVWEQLSPATGQRLMQAVIGFLQEGTALKRLLPLLWPLADSASPASRTAAAYPPALRQQLLAALAAYPLPTAPAAGQQQAEGQACAAASHVASPATDPLAEKRDLLLSALRAVWD